MIEVNIFGVKEKDYYSVEIDKNDKISTILDKLSEQEGFQRDGMRLFFRDKFLNENFTYVSCEIDEAAVLQFYSPHLQYDEPYSILPLPNPSLGYLCDSDKK